MLCHTDTFSQHDSLSCCEADPVRLAQTGGCWRGREFRGTLNGLSFLWQLSKDELGLSPLRPLALPNSERKLTGKMKRNLCLRLCSNYTWHVNGREGRQSRKLAAKEDKGEDQEWHRMSLNFTLSFIFPCSAYCWLLPYFSLLDFFFLFLAPAQPAPAVWLCPSFCQSLFLCYTLHCLNISSDCLCSHKWMRSLLWLHKSVSQCD